MSERTERFVAEWNRFADAFEARDHGAGLVALRNWIVAWDECFWAEELEVFAEAYAPDVVAEAHLPFPGKFDFTGLEGFRWFRDEASDVMSNFRFDVTGLEWEGDRFAGFGHVRTRGRFTRLVFRFPNAVVWTYADRKITRIESFASHRRARALLRTPATAVS